MTQWKLYVMGKERKHHFQKLCEFPRDGHILEMTAFQETSVLKQFRTRSKSSMGYKK
jgi:hypothetical protein